MTVVALKRRADDHTQSFVHIDDSLFVGRSLKYQPPQGKVFNATKAVIPRLDPIRRTDPASRMGLPQLPGKVPAKSEENLKKIGNHQSVAIGVFFQNAAQQGCCARAYMDVFTAFLKKHPDGHALTGKSIGEFLDSVADAGESRAGDCADMARA